jgi:O-antigen ligase
MNKLSTYLWYLLIVAAPFSVRTFISGPEPFHEYTSIFLYASDIMLVLFVLSVLPRIKGDIRALPWRGTLAIFLLVALVSLLISSAFTLSLVAFLRVIFLVGAAVGARYLLADKKIFMGTLALIGLLALFQATVAIAQFTGQGSVGLGLLGESPISVFDPGTAKITVEGARLLRSYGTLPDPNILAGFLVVGLGALLYLFLNSDKGLYGAFDTSKSLAINFQNYVANRLLYVRIVVSAAAFMVGMGLLFTFSRSGWLSAAIMLLVMLVGHLGQSLRASLRLLALFAMIAGALYYFFSPLILARSSFTKEEASFSYRVEYATIGVETIKDEPLVGVGIGNQVNEAIEEGRYKAHGITRLWEYQPIHNLYLLIVSEIGLIGGLSFIAFLAIVIWQLVRARNLEANLALALLAGLLLFGLFDHFLWDIQQGRFMLWIVIALALSQRKLASFKADAD